MRRLSPDVEMWSWGNSAPVRDEFHGVMIEDPNGAYVAFDESTALLAARDARIAELEACLEARTKGLTERDHCWHCRVRMVPVLHCEDCPPPGECDVDGCQADGCQADGTAHENAIADTIADAIVVATEARRCFGNDSDGGVYA